MKSTQRGSASLLRKGKKALDLKNELSFEKLKEISRINERFSQIPLIANGWVHVDADTSKTTLPTVFVCRSQTDRRNQACHRSLETYISRQQSADSLQFSRVPWSIPVKCSNAHISPSGRLRAMYSTIKAPKTGTDAGDGNGDSLPLSVIEIWDNFQLLHTVNLQKTVCASKIHSSGPLSGLSFSSDERFLAFIAERKSLKHGKFGAQMTGKPLAEEFDEYSAVSLMSDASVVESEVCEKLAKKKKSALKDVDKMGSAFEFEYREDFGEQMDGAKNTSVFIYDMRTQQLIDPLKHDDDKDEEDTEDCEDGSGEKKVSESKSKTVESCVKSDEPFYEGEYDLSKFALGECSFAPDNCSMVAIGRHVEGLYHRRLGFKFYNTRPTKLFWIRFADASLKKVWRVVDLAANCWSATAPRFSPNGRQLVFLTTNDTTPHRSASRLCAMQWPPLLSTDYEAADARTVIDIDTEVTSTQVIRDGAFPGLFSSFVEELAPRCFLDDETLLISTFWRNVIALLRVNVCTGEWQRLDTDDAFGRQLVEGRETELQNEGLLRSVELLDVVGSANGLGFGLLKVSSSQRGQELYLLQSTATGSSQLSLVSSFADYIRSLPSVNTWSDSNSTVGTSDVPLSDIRDIKTQVFSIDPSDGSGEFVDCLFFYPPQSVLRKRPERRTLLIFPHGGPHSMSLATFSNIINGFLFEGYAVVQPNYRGSLGFGERFVHSLLGNIGTVDVNDCFECLDFVRKHMERESEVPRVRCLSFGWSHSGFVGAHLVAQFPEAFEACCLGNPVVSLNAEYASTDIPDWVLTEMGADMRSQLNAPLTADTAAKMVRMSPITYVDNVKTPTQILIGTKDVRVPMAQSILYYRLLKARIGSDARLLCYPNGQHGLADSKEEDTDVWCNILAWFAYHLGYGRTTHK